MYGENTPRAGGSSRRGSAVPKGVWVFVKRIKHPGLRTRLLANGQIMHTHVCIKCWARLKLGYISTELRFVTTAAVAHLRLHDGDETGEASKLKQIAKTASITLGMLGAGGMANYVVRAATCQVESISIFERRLRRTGRPDYRRVRERERGRERGGGGGFGALVIHQRSQPSKKGQKEPHHGPEIRNFLQDTRLQSQRST